MLLDPYYTQQESSIKISAEQASVFAKKECQDFNPIHDPDSKRFCVPGDLLFALALKEYGVSESMNFTFTNMVGDSVALNFPKTDSDHIIVTNDQGKSVLEIKKSGKSSDDIELIESLIKKYVVFSGQNFPTLLMPLMNRLSCKVQSPLGLSKINARIINALPEEVIDPDPINRIFPE